MASAVTLRVPLRLAKWNPVDPGSRRRDTARMVMFDDLVTESAAVPVAGWDLSWLETHPGRTSGLPRRPSGSCTCGIGVDTAEPAPL
jgi:hypothetical protein